MRYGHGSIITLRDGMMGVEVGLPAPPGYVPIIPKYVPCDRGPWSRRSLRFCRVIERYGPAGVSEAFTRSGLVLTYDPSYGTLMPYVRLEEALEYVSPREALQRRALSGKGSLSHVLSNAISFMGSLVGSFETIGLTGSYAMELEADFSDVDLVVYGGEGARLAYEGFRSRASPVDCRMDFGGLSLVGWPCLPWRRGAVEVVPVPVSWVGAPIGGPAAHCPPLIGGIAAYGLSQAQGVLTVPPGQETSLLYPPCVRTEEGVYIISFEYNVGGPLYEGGEVKVHGLGALRARVILLGSREKPGRLELLKPKRA